MSIAEDKKIKALRSLSVIVDRASKKQASEEMKALKSFKIGEYIVKRQNNAYHVYKDSICIYDNIVVPEIMLTVVNRLIEKRKHTISGLLKLEKEYLKHINDMKFYLHSYRQAQLSGSNNRFVFQDRFDIANDRATIVKKKIQSLIDVI